ncbi:MAG: hypothetical protein ACREKM_02325 [Longimicrobiales bacterium]
MTAGSWPTATPFDLESGAEPEVLSLLFGGPDAELAGVLLLAGPGARRDGWAARVAISLATAWSQRSGPVVLADACLESPELHGLLAEPNGEGVADVFQFGASLRRVRRTLEGRAFEFIPAGVYVPDPPGVLRHGAWTRLLEDTVAMGRRLMVFAPAAAEGVDVLAERIGAVAWLAADDDDIDPSTLNADLRAVLVPPQQAPSGPVIEPLSPRRPDAEFERLRLPQGSARESHIADLRIQQRSTVLGRRTDQAEKAAGRMPPPPAAERVPPSPDADLTEPLFADPVEVRSGLPLRPLILTLIVVALVSLLAGAWHFVGRALWTARTSTSAATVLVPGDSAAGAPSVPELTGAVRALPVSIAMEAYTNLPEALERVRALAAVEEDVGFLVSPTLIDSVLYYRVMAGPLPDTLVADSLTERMIRSGSKSGRMGNEIDSTPLAFLIGDYDSERAAGERLIELEQLGIPTYIVSLALPEGDRYRLYGGAYSGRGEADVMRQLLHNAGVQDSLVTRVGSSAS